MQRAPQPPPAKSYRPQQTHAHLQPGFAAEPRTNDDKHRSWGVGSWRSSHPSLPTSMPFLAIAYPSCATILSSPLQNCANSVRIPLPILTFLLKKDDKCKQGKPQRTLWRCTQLTPVLPPCSVSKQALLQARPRWRAIHAVSRPASRQRCRHLLPPCAPSWQRRSPPQHLATPFACPRLQAGDGKWGLLGSWRGQRQRHMAWVLALAGACLCSQARQSPAHTVTRRPGNPHLSLP